MYNASFYPTPPEVAEKMLAKVGKLYERSILEPSAGKGDLADAAVGKLDRYYNRCREVVHCIEIEPELQAAIRGKGYPLVGTDFLTFWPDEKYDLILMNPPFANGDAPLAPCVGDPRPWGHRVPAQRADASEPLHVKPKAAGHNH